MKKGSIDIKMAIGGTPVSKAYQGSQQVYSSGPSYDAQVEYLETTGTQYINTGITLNNITDWQIELNFAPTRFYNYNALMCIGTSTANESWIDSSGYFWFRFNSTKSSGVLIPLNTQTNLKVTYSNGVCTIYFDNVQKTTFSASPTTVTDALWIMHRVQFAEIKCFGFKVTRSGVLVCDMVPVRKGTTGYMYDSVRNRLFGNAGTGDFTYGNDV